MKLQTVLALTTATLSVSAGKFLDPTFYAREVAPRESSRIEDYRAAHVGNLTPEQTIVLDDIQAAIPSPADADLPGLENACFKAFEAAECKFLLTGKTAASKMKRDNNLIRRAMCDCSDESDWCDDGFRCSYHQDSCGVYSGCGTLNAYPCDGLCIVQ
ncbi:uncharacterized protein F4822DRAFT_429747 [Hypoxylon trugodes]|uniref:uncharacterized protein n=1 Tax=Hypoxylon trugodes TaxID=326681 RepID=UPI0021A1145F|nr:uncharacterized protein F4822DRAFT_429747 [Hypoxylon trugodes]KAI1389133.1 hypothetical protein F4822DRAFT_429747 [Hypoxylon trugodes]